MKPGIACWSVSQIMKGHSIINVVGSSPFAFENVYAGFPGRTYSSNSCIRFLIHVISAVQGVAAIDDGYGGLLTLRTAEAACSVSFCASTTYDEYECILSPTWIIRSI